MEKRKFPGGEARSWNYRHKDLAKMKLQLNCKLHGTICNDLRSLRQQAQDNLQKHIHEVVPMEYQKCMTGMKSNLKETLEIANTVTDPRVKL